MNGGKKSIWEVWKVLWDITENCEIEKKGRKQDENKRQIRCYGYDAGKYGDADLKLCIAVDVWEMYFNSFIRWLIRPLWEKYLEWMRWQHSAL